jgi:hypothetical protein
MGVLGPGRIGPMTEVNDGASTSTASTGSSGDLAGRAGKPSDIDA